MKKFESLGRSLTKNEQKKIKGGDETVELGGEGGVYCKQEGTACGGGGVCISRWADVHCCCSVDPEFGGSHSACNA